MTQVYVVQMNSRVFGILAIANEAVDLRFLMAEGTVGKWFDVEEPAQLESFLREYVPDQSLVGPLGYGIGMQIAHIKPVFDQISHLVQFQLIGV